MRELRERKRSVNRVKLEASRGPRTLLDVEVPLPPELGERAVGAQEHALDVRAQSLRQLQHG
jgi:hypothetical protein